MLTKTELETLLEILEELKTDYESIPIGGGNPYYMCPHCEVSDPEISIRGHDSSCQINKSIKRKEVIEGIIKKFEA